MDEMMYAGGTPGFYAPGGPGTGQPFPGPGYSLTGPSFGPGMAVGRPVPPISIGGPGGGTAIGRPVPAPQPVPQPSVQPIRPFPGQQPNIMSQTMDAARLQGARPNRATNLQDRIDRVSSRLEGAEGERAQALEGRLANLRRRLSDISDSAQPISPVDEGIARRMTGDMSISQRLGDGLSLNERLQARLANLQAPTFDPGSIQDQGISNVGGGGMDTSMFPMFGSGPRMPDLSGLGTGLSSVRGMDTSMFPMFGAGPRMPFMGISPSPFMGMPSGRLPLSPFMGMSGIGSLLAGRSQRGFVPQMV